MTESAQLKMKNETRLIRSKVLPKAEVHFHILITFSFYNFSQKKADQFARFKEPL